MAVTGPLAFHTIGQRLLDAAAPVLGEVQRVGMVPGQIAWDDCECGLLAGSVSRMWMTENFPQEASATQCHAGLLVGEIVIQALRCAPSLTGMDVAPTVAELDAAAQETISDGWHLLQTTVCTLAAMETAGDIVEWLVRPMSFAGPMGLCVGPQLTALVAIHHGPAL